MPAVDGGLQLGQRIAEHVGAGRQAQRLGGEAADAFAVHRQARGARGGDHAHHALGLELLQHRAWRWPRSRARPGRGFSASISALQLRRVAHRDGARVVRHLLAGRVLVAVDGDGLDAQALQRDQHFLAELAGAQQHHAGGGRAKGACRGACCRWS